MVAPSYDLAAVLQRSGEVTLSPATFGPLSANTSFGTGPQKEKPWSERFQLPIGIALAALLGALALWTIRLLRNAKRGDEPPQPPATGD
jgi:hypothetical protein